MAILSPALCFCRSVRSVTRLAAGVDGPPYTASTGTVDARRVEEGGAGARGGGDWRRPCGRQAPPHPQRITNPAPSRLPIGARRPGRGRGRTAGRHPNRGSGAGGGSRCWRWRAAAVLAGGELGWEARCGEAASAPPSSRSKRRRAALPCETVGAALWRVAGPPHARERADSRGRGGAGGRGFPRPPGGWGGRPGGGRGAKRAAPARRGAPGQTRKMGPGGKAYKIDGATRGARSADVGTWGRLSSLVRCARRGWLSLGGA